MNSEDDFDPEAESVVWVKNEASEEEDEVLDPWQQRKDVVLWNDEGLESIPESLIALSSTPRIRCLYLFSNLLTEIPSSISHLTNLRELDLSHNRISSIHDNLSLLPHLETLNLIDNKLPSFPLIVTKIPSLQILQLGSNNLTSIPPEISLLTNLSSLELRYNQITKLPETITTMTNLTNLNLFNNCLTAFPNMVLQMSGLLNLELRNNHIASVPSNISSYLPTTRVAASVPHRVLEGFYIGDYATSTNVASLKNSKITHILTVMNCNEPAPFPMDFVYKKFSVRDDEDEDLFTIFAQCHEFIETGRKHSGVLVHCAAGVSRSATIVLSYLMKMRKTSFECELEFLRTVRPMVDPNPGFVKQLKLYEKEWDC